MHVIRKQAIWRCEKHLAPTDSQALLNEGGLATTVADVLDDGVREHDVKASVLERQPASIGLNRRRFGMHRPKARQRVNRQAYDVLRPRVRILEEVLNRLRAERRGPAGSRGNTDVQQSMARIGPTGAEELIELLTA